MLLSGLAEIALCAALVGPRRWRAHAGRALAAYLVAVFPANVYVAVAGVEVDGQPGGAYPWLRLPFQVLFVVWALWSTGTGQPACVSSNPSSTATSRPPASLSSM